MVPSRTGPVRSRIRQSRRREPDPGLVWNTVRHRINRGGDRRLNHALHMAVVTRMRMDPTTRAYVEKRTAEGRTLREIRAASSATLPARSTATSDPLLAA